MTAALPRLVTAAIALMAVSATTALGQTTTQDLKRMSLEDLTAIEVSTVSRTPEPTKSVPAAVFVITQEDIRRSGATTLPELLRLAPGIQVARIDASRYALGMRGFADRLARAMLVMIDGRAVYSPLFAGTYWEVQDTLLQDVERIEVIRGPGGTLWGANAVNGIINIITKSAADTEGLLVTADIGTDPRGLVGVRFGGRAGANGRLRAYLKAFQRDAELHSDRLDYDDWHMVQGGFRGDWSLAGSRTLTIRVTHTASDSARKRRSSRTRRPTAKRPSGPHRCRVRTCSRAGPGRPAGMAAFSCRPITIGPSATRSRSPRQETRSTSTSSTGRGAGRATTSSGARDTASRTGGSAPWRRHSSSPTTAPTVSTAPSSRMTSVSCRIGCARSSGSRSSTTPTVASSSSRAAASPGR